MKKRYSLGIDFGTNSCRALIVSLDNGREIATFVSPYRRGVEGVVLDRDNPLVARQDPHDYVESLEEAVKGAIRQAREKQGFSPEDIIGVGVDTTGSTPIPVDKEGKPLSFIEKFSNNLNALAWLWKDHSSFSEAASITETAREKRPQYLKKCGGVYSSEWFFSKIWHLAKVDKEAFKASHSFVELADFIPGLLTGETRPDRLKRSVCAAGHKAMYNEEWGGLPDEEFLETLTRDFKGLRQRLYTKAYPAGRKAGGLDVAWAKKLGLKSGIAVSVGAFDAHMGAVGCGIKPGTLVKIMGTSTCDMMIFPHSHGETLADIPGLCGIVDGSIMEGYLGLEAGQSAVGDIFNWFIKNFIPGGYVETAAKEGLDLHQYMTRLSENIKPGETGLLALDWHNGNRTILVDPRLTGLIIGETLNTRPEEVYRTLIEATAYGARVIINRLEEYGVKVEEIIACGGLAEKNPLLMQIYADVTARPLKVSRSSQTCALGAAIFGAVAAGPEGGGFKGAEDGIACMTGVKDIVFRPEPHNRIIYDELFKLYEELHDSFGTSKQAVSLYPVMKKLINLREKIRCSSRP